LYSERKPDSFSLAAVQRQLAACRYPASTGQSYLRLDPLAAFLTAIAARQWLPSLAPGLALLCLAFATGRFFFCGWLCPFGATLHLVRKLLPRKKLHKEHDRFTQPSLRRLKYLALAIMLGTALLGVTTLFWGAPIPLITRFYALLLHPCCCSRTAFWLSAGRCSIR
jgi:polyferredoxin